MAAITEQRVEQLSRSSQVEFAADCVREVIQDRFPRELARTRQHDLYAPLERVAAAIKQYATDGDAGGLDSAVAAAEHVESLARLIPTMPSKRPHGARGTDDRNATCRVAAFAVKAAQVAQNCSALAVWQLYEEAIGFADGAKGPLETALQKLEAKAKNDRSKL